MTVKLKSTRRGGICVISESRTSKDSGTVRFGTIVQSSTAAKLGWDSKTGLIVKSKVERFVVRDRKTGKVVKVEAASKPTAARTKLKVCNLNEFLIVNPITEEDRKHAYRTGRFAEMTAKQAGLTD